MRRHFYTEVWWEIVFFNKWFSRKTDTPAGSAASLSLFPLCSWTAPQALGVIPAAWGADALCDTLSRLFPQMHRFRVRRESEPMRFYFTEDAYRAFSARIEDDKRAHAIAHADRIAVLDCTLQGSYQAEGQTHVVAKVRTRMVNWLESDESWTCIGGDTRREHFADVFFDLAPAPKDRSVIQAVCPSCGALTDVLENAQCAFCGHVSAMGAGAWVIAAAQERSQTP